MASPASTQKRYITLVKYSYYVLSFRPFFYLYISLVQSLSSIASNYSKTTFSLIFMRFRISFRRYYCPIIGALSCIIQYIACHRHQPQTIRTSDVTNSKNIFLGRSSNNQLQNQQLNTNHISQTQQSRSLVPT